MKRICVFCGANAGKRPVYTQAAAELGRAIAKRGIELVYGAGSIGLMGALADTVLDAGGRVIGIIPRSLVQKEVAHTGLSELRIVDSMHERKAQMADLSDGFIALPGGIGTLEELLEVLTWAQLGHHTKPCGLLNVAGYYDPLVRFLDQLVTESFMMYEHRKMLLEATTAEGILMRCSSYRPRHVDQWITRKQL